MRWPDDPVARYVVACHPEGLTAPQVSKVLELAISNVHRDQASAARKLRALAAHPELGFIARAWADATGDYAVDDGRGAARERVLHVMREARSAMSCRRIRALARVRMRTVQLVLADALAVGLVHAAVSGKRHTYVLTDARS